MANLTYRIGDEWKGIADLVMGEEAAQQHLNQALKYYESAYKQYVDLVKLDPASLDKQDGLLYTIFQLQQVTFKMQARASSVRWGFAYLLHALQVYLPLLQKEPDYPKARQKVEQFLGRAGTMRSDLADTWQELVAAEPGSYDLLADIGESLLQPMLFPTPEFTAKLMKARARLAFQLDQLAAHAPLPNRTATVRTKLRPSEAPAIFDEALATSWLDEGSRLQSESKYTPAIAAYRQAVKIQPDMPDALTALAWILATCPSDMHRDGKEAIGYAIRACELSRWKDAAQLSILAAAYAEAGEFAKALEYQAKAIETPEFDSNMKGLRKERLKLYQSTQPYRDIPKPKVAPADLDLGTYSAKFPGETTRNYINVEDNIVIIQDQITLKGTRFLIATNTFNNDLDTKTRLRFIRDGTVGDGQLLSEQIGHLGKEKYPMIEVSFLKDREYIRNRGILVGNRLFQVIVTSRNQKDLTSDVANTLYESFSVDPAAVEAFNKARLTRVEQRKRELENYLAGRAKPKTAADSLALAELCQAQSRWADSARLYEIAFALDPKLTDDLRDAYRYYAASSALSAAHGVGINAPTDAKDQAELRTKALHWLSADLTLWKALATSSQPEDRARAEDGMKEWLDDNDLAHTLPQAKREGWNKQECTVWDTFWADVKAVLATASQPAPPREVAPPPRVAK